MIFWVKIKIGKKSHQEKVKKNQEKLSRVGACQVIEKKMDLSPSPFWIKKQQQGSVFDFKNIPVENHPDGDSDDDETSEIIIGKIFFRLIFFLRAMLR